MNLEGLAEMINVYLDEQEENMAQGDIDIHGAVLKQFIEYWKEQWKDDNE